MNFNEYQRLAARTDVLVDYDEIETIHGALLNAAMGMVGESGEVMDHLKKIFFQGHEIDKDKFIEEAGDCLWYIAKLARVCGVRLEDVAIKNIEKLKKRYPNGFEVDRSVNRED